MSLEQLIAKCKKQELKAQEQLYRLYSVKLFSVSLKYSSDYAQAEDNLQDAFLTIFDKIEQYKNKGSFEGWMKRIVINTALQHYRKQGVFQLVNEELLEAPEVTIETNEIALEFLLKIVQALPDRYRMVFNLYVLDGFSHKEIAEMLNITTGTSKSNLSRARTILKEKIEKKNYHKLVKSN